MRSFLGDGWKIIGESENILFSELEIHRKCIIYGGSRTKEIRN